MTKIQKIDRLDYEPVDELYKVLWFLLVYNIYSK